MITLFGSHEVSDYEKWKSLFGRAMSQIGKQNGIQESKVYRTVDGNRVVVSHTFNNKEDVERHLAFMGDPDGQAKAAQNGVVFPVTLWVVEEVDI